MFTGLIEATGKILGVEERPGARRIAVEAPVLAERLREGDSIAVSGVCLTALDIAAPVFYADLAAETIARTSLTALKAGAAVNLELPTPAGAPLGGHIVQGHVDGTGTLRVLRPLTPGAENTDWWLEIEVPEHLRGYMVEKGSIAIEGISLTIARWDGAVVSVAIIPHTYAATNLHTLTPGSPVNLEADVLIKHALQKTKAPEFELTVDYLIANGY
ncbi:riboflavin synthase [Silvibacterium dinghuense]|uniref:Riboflavin synthase n=1 Tax=Silvibacterium dinghuense TaxID=1560006 RepID=A0A4Q1SBE3_9BACT|nr:riboflavin synthase [Silvibacterium dinghuense]RXS94448.1 riboflavin synthase [Silvibacterium dinghuense]GGH16046.1 riboflavin synthase subunit alpha [Silvibacterium dinghuense]